MNLISLTLENFKGIKAFTLDATGQNVDVYGSNGCGKSTLFDAFTWLLFGKNSHDEKDFGIKTLDENGEVIPRIDHKVTAVIEHDGRQIELTRTYKEKWRKQRGAAEAVMVGNTTEYAYGPVGAATPISVGEYAKAINGLIDEKIFKLITDPLYFNERLSWQERRQLLMQLCGDVTDEEIVKDNADLEEQAVTLKPRKKVSGPRLEPRPKRKMKSVPELTNVVRDWSILILRVLTTLGLMSRRFPKGLKRCGRKRCPSPPWTKRSKRRKNWQRLRQRLWRLNQPGKRNIRKS